MSVQPVQKINRVDFVTGLVTGVMLEMGVVIALLPKPMANIVNAGSGGDTSNLIRLAILFAALCVAYSLGRVINIVTMRMWRPEALSFFGVEPAGPEGAVFPAKSHRDRFEDVLKNPSLLDETIVREFKYRADHAIAVDGPFFADEADGGERGGSEPDEGDSDETDGSEDYASFWPFVLSYVRINGGDFAIYLETVFSFTRNSTVLFSALTVLYVFVWIATACGLYPDSTPFTNQALLAKLLVVSSLLGMTILFYFGTKQNRDDYVKYLISDFVSLRIVEDDQLPGTSVSPPNDSSDPDS